MAHTNKTTSSYSKGIIPSLTSSTSHSSPSVLTNNIRIVSHGALDLVKVKAELEPDAITIYSNGGLSDTDEIKGEEREAAIKSPPKGKKWVTSEVSLLPFIVIIYYFKYYP